MSFDLEPLKIRTALASFESAVASDVFSAGTVAAFNAACDLVTCARASSYAFVTLASAAVAFSRSASSTASCSVTFPTLACVLSADRYWLIAVTHSVESQVSFEFFTNVFFAHLYLNPETVVVAFAFDHAVPLLIFAAEAGDAVKAPAIRAVESRAIAILRDMKTPVGYSAMVARRFQIYA